MSMVKINEFKVGVSNPCILFVVPIIKLSCFFLILYVKVDILEIKSSFTVYFWINIGDFTCLKRKFVHVNIRRLVLRLDGIVLFRIPFYLTFYHDRSNWWSKNWLFFRSWHALFTGTSLIFFLSNCIIICKVFYHSTSSSFIFAKNFHGNVSNLIVKFQIRSCIRIHKN